MDAVGPMVHIVEEVQKGTLSGTWDGIDGAKVTYGLLNKAAARPSVYRFRNTGNMHASCR